MLTPANMANDSKMIPAIVRESDTDNLRKEDEFVRGKDT